MVETRRILKKEKFVITRKGRFVLNLSNKIVKSLKPYCKKIQVVGSIRRKEKNPVDVDITLIPKNNKSKKKIENNLRNKGRFVQGGEKRATFRIKGVKIELYYTTEDSWGATLLAYSSRFGAGIGLRIVARKKGFKLNQYGLFRGNKKVAGKTEEEIYHALGREWKAPELR